MADEKISQFAEIPGGPLNADRIPIVRPGNPNNYHVKIADLKNNDGGGGTVELDTDFGKD